MAVIAEQAGQKVCLIDADMRRGTQHKYFGRSRVDLGLSQYLSGEATADAVLSATEVSGLSIITSGSVPPNPSELLMRPEMASLIKRLDASFDLILVDAPPVLAVTDPVVIGRTVGAVIAVARFGVTHPAEVQAMEKTLEAGGVKLSGAILNGFDPKKARGRSAYAYNGRYDYR